MTAHEAKARSIVDWLRRNWDMDGSSLTVDLVSAISTALREATLAEREACAKIAENDDSFMMLQDFGLQSAVMQKGQNIATAIRGRNSTDE